MWLGLLELVGGLVILVFAGDYLVSSAIKIAKYFKVEPMIIGLTIISFGTSFPELVVSVNATLADHSDIAIGNVVGSNIANLGLVLGVMACIRPIVISRGLFRFDWPIMILSTCAFVFLALFQMLVWWLGLAFIIVLIVYNLVKMRSSKVDSSEFGEEEVVSTVVFLRSSALLTASLAALIFGADTLVEGAVGMAKHWGVPECVIAASIVAFGTSVPELITAISSIRHREMGVGLGNIIGSNIFNILGIVGVTSLVKPIAVNDAMLHFDFWYCLAIPILIYPIIWWRGKVDLLAGFMLLSSYIFYIAYLI